MLNHDGPTAVASPPGSTLCADQPSRLLAKLFEPVEPGARLRVLDLGPALPETIAFLNQFHCSLHIVDLQQEDAPQVDSELDESERIALWRAHFNRALSLPNETKFDLIFFWDSLNFLSRDAIAALVVVLLPHLHGQTQAHCFAVHSVAAPASTVYHGIRDAGTFSVRPRTSQPPDYQPLPPGQHASLLHCFETDRSVLMRDQRTELLLKASL